MSEQTGRAIIMGTAALIAEALTIAALIGLGFVLKPALGWLIDNFLWTYATVFFGFLAYVAYRAILAWRSLPDDVPTFIAEARRAADHQRPR